MSGHSKWKNIMHKKEKTDAQRAKIFTMIGKEMSIAIREGGSDPNSNGKLRELIAKAKANNVPNDNIDRLLKKFSGDNNIVYDEITYEGYGPGGVAVIVTTNLNTCFARIFGGIINKIAFLIEYGFSTARIFNRFHMSMHFHKCQVGRYENWFWLGNTLRHNAVTDNSICNGDFIVFFRFACLGRTRHCKK